MFDTLADIESFIRRFEAGTLPASQWTHQAHFVVGLWYLAHHAPDEALTRVRRGIRAYNEATGTLNTDHSGYHETLTRFHLDGIATHLRQHGDRPLPEVLRSLLRSALVERDRPLAFYTRERLMSVQARREWLAPDRADTAAARISARIAELGDWRGAALRRVRSLILESDPEIVEEWKWTDTPVWSHDGIVCTGESYKDKLKLTFPKGASLADPAGLFNASLDGKVRRAIDIREGDALDAAAFQALIRQAVAANAAAPAKRSKRAKA